MYSVFTHICYSAVRDDYFHRTNMKRFFYFQCMGHTWYLSVDMQLFIIAPFIVYLLYRFKLKILVVVILAIFVSMSITFYTYMSNGNDAIRWKNSRIPLIDCRRIQRKCVQMCFICFRNYMKLIYYPTQNRMFTWLLGVVLGYFVFHTRNQTIHIPRVSKNWPRLTETALKYE